MHNEDEHPLIITKSTPILVNPNMRFRVEVRWIKGVSILDVLVDVNGFRLEDDVYFFYIDSEGLDQPKIHTVWVKHPNMRSLEIVPYIKES